MYVQELPTSPYTPVGASNMQGSSPALQGLSASKSPMAQELQSMGRGEDSMLVHMTPNEVNSLQGLAMAAGGSLTINPQTGLPEAGWLGRLLPTILGVAGAAFGLPTWAMGLGVGAGKAAVSGDLNKGLMAGLEAFGGAGIGQAAGLGGAISNNAMGLLGSQAASSGATSALAHGASNAAVPAAMNAAPAASSMASMASAPVAHGVGNAAVSAATNAAPAAAKAPGLLSKFADATSLGQTGMLGKALPFAAGAATLNAVSDATAPKPITPEQEEFKYTPVGPLRRSTRFQTPEEMRRSRGAEFNYFTPSNPNPLPLYDQPRYAEGGSVATPNDDFNNLVAMYQAQNPGPITASMYPTPPAPPITPSAPPMHIAPNIPGTTGEIMHSFNRPDVSTPSTAMGGLNSTSKLPTPFIEELLRLGGQGGGMRSMYPMDTYAYASGGEVNMEDGSFVVDARTVSELGNGSSNAGIEMLSKMGGKPVRGPGDGVSDSVKASIGGAQEARVARDEVIFSPEAVRRIGGGSEAKGTQKLYAMMDKAHKARKKAGRGQDTGLRRGLA